MNLPRNEIISLYASAKCFVFPPEEDFWLVPIEAQATGTPVIAYWVWWALETVIEWKTGVFFKEQTPKSLQKALDKFETMSFDPSTIRKHAEQFDNKIFENELVSFIQNKINS